MDSGVGTENERKGRREGRSACAGGEGGNAAIFMNRKMVEDYGNSK